MLMIKDMLKTQKLKSSGYDKEKPISLQFVSENRIGIMIALFMIVLGSVVYFGFGFSERNDMGAEVKTINPKIYNDMNIKTAYTPEGVIKIFVYSKEFKNIEINAVGGKSIAKDNLIVVGFEEANMMKEEGLFKNINDNITGFFGVDVIIGGILEKTGTPIDDMHFVSEYLFNKIEGDEDKLFIKLKKGIPKLFLEYDLSDDKDKITFELIEGKTEDYQISEIDDKTYYPLIMGYKEAMMMKEGKIISNVGDKLNDYFGKDFIIMGIAKETNTSLDMMHIVSLRKEEFNIN